MHLVRRCRFAAGGLAALLLAGPAVPAEVPESFDDLVKGAHVELAPAANGGVVALDKESGVLARWGADGRLNGSCTVERLGFPADQVNEIAADGSWVLVSTLAAAAPSGGAAGYLVDLASCEVKRELVFTRPVKHLARTRDGWVAVTLPAAVETAADSWPGCDATLLTDDGRPAGTLAPPSGLLARWREADGRPSACGLSRVVVAGRFHWVIPYDRYELWRPKQGGLGENRLEPPLCLAATERSYTGGEAVEQVRARLAAAPPELRERLEAAAAAGSAVVRVPAVSFAASWGYLAAVAVRVTGEGGAAGCRVDVWDLGLERLVYTRTLDGLTCPGFLAVGNDVVWTVDAAGAVVRLELPPVLEPLADPCAQPARQGTVPPDPGT